MRTPQVEVSTGRLFGRREDGVDAFLGIPYAAPPTGERRFLAPQPALPWGGVLDATLHCAAPPQNALDAGALPGMEVGEQGEDCLTLNVFTPSADAGKRPVMVWIHGGAFVIGAGSQAIYDGRPLARAGDVVVVTINYRLGALGFLDLAPRFGDVASTSGNLGLRDQIAALDWVQENIARFGGDPDQVTIFGESAGGMSIGSLLGSPAARGRFRRAIPQSGAAHNAHDPDTAARVLDYFLESIDATEWSDLCTAPLARILDAQLRCMLRAADLGVLLPFQPVVGDDVLPEPPLDAVRAGNAAGVPVLIGTTRNEWSLFAFMDSDLTAFDDAELHARAVARVGEAHAGRVAESYRKQAPVASPMQHFISLETDHVFRVPAARLADAQSSHAPVFVYEFAWASPALAGALGACHALELPFVFGALDKPGMAEFAGDGEDARALCENVMSAWLAFARDGDPSHSGLPGWPQHDPAARPTLVLDRESRLELAPRSATLKVWDGLR